MRVNENPSDRPMLIFVSDIHLTDQLHGSEIDKGDNFERFWERIGRSRGKRPAHLCFAGDLFDLVRSPCWFETRARPFHDPRGDVSRHVVGIVERTIAREASFFQAIRKRAEAGELEVHYVLGNHDRLLGHSPQARRLVWKALTGRDEDVTFPGEIEFPDHGVLAYHGHKSDPMNFDADGAATIGDAIGSELITRFPREVRKRVGDGFPELDDIDDVRPIYAVPAWVRRLSAMNHQLLNPVGNSWTKLVEEFFSEPFVREWLRDHNKRLAFDTGKKLRLLLELSTKKIMAHTHDRRLTQLYKYFQHSFDGKMARQAASELSSRRGYRFVVNGHSHFSSMVPLGHIDGKAAVYFNTGTWRTVHQIGHGLGGRPSFLPYDAMSYLVFFPDGDRLGRDFEWWSGAMVARSKDASANEN